MKAALMLKYTGKIWDLKRLTWDSGLRGYWTNHGNRLWRFDWRGAVLNFWPSTHTVQFQGADWAAVRLKKCLLDYARNNGLDAFVEGRRVGKESSSAAPGIEALPMRVPFRLALPSNVIEGEWEEVDDALEV